MLIRKHLTPRPKDRPPLPPALIENGSKSSIRVPGLLFLVKEYYIYNSILSYGMHEETLNLSYF